MRSSSSARSLSLCEPRSAPRAAASSAAIIQSGQAKPGALSLGPRRVTRPSRLVVVPGTLVLASRRAGRRRRGRRPTARGARSRRRRSGRPTSAALATAWSGKSLSGSAPSRTQGADGGAAPSPVPALSPAMEARTPAVSRPAAAGTEPQAAVKRSRPASSVTRPGQQARGQAHVERAEHVAPAQRGEERGLGQRCGQHAQGGGGHLARLGVGGAPGHDDDAVATGMLGQQSAARLRARRRPARCPRGACRAPWRPRRHRSGPWPRAARHRAGWPGWRRRAVSARSASARSRSASGSPRRGPQAQEEDRAAPRAGRRPA